MPTPKHNAAPHEPRGGMTDEQRKRFEAWEGKARRPEKPASRADVDKLIGHYSQQIAEVASRPGDHSPAYTANCANAIAALERVRDRFPEAA